MALQFLRVEIWSAPGNEPLSYYDHLINKQFILPKLFTGSETEATQTKTKKQDLR